MLTTAELRQGNLLTWSLKLTHPETTLPDETVEVQTVYNDRISYLYPNLENRVEPFEDDKAEQAAATIPLAELQPIALTEEWLAKAGVQLKDGIAAVQSVLYQWNGTALEAQSDDTFPAGKPFEYLHQLQNHIADHTGKPLDINFNWTQP